VSFFSLTLEGEASEPTAEKTAKTTFCFTNAVRGHADVTSAQKKKENLGSAAVSFSSRSDSGTKAAQDRWQVR
jgi:hypothetical protein